MATFVFGLQWGRTERTQTFEQAKVRAAELGVVPHAIEPVPGMAGWWVLRGPSSRDPVIYSDDLDGLHRIVTT